MAKRIAAFFAAICVLTSVLTVYAEQPDANNTHLGGKSGKSGIKVSSTIKITPEDVERLIYKGNLRMNKRADEFLEYKLPWDEDPPLMLVSLKKLIDPYKSVPLYPELFSATTADTVVRPWLSEKSDDYYHVLLQHKAKQDDESYFIQDWICQPKSEYSDVKLYILETEDHFRTETENFFDEYIKTDTSLNLTPIYKKNKDKTEFVFNFAEIAKIINNGDAGRIEHILIMQCNVGFALYVDGEKGEYFIFEDRIRDDGAKYLGKEVAKLPAKTLIPVNDYIDFYHNWTDNVREAYKEYYRKLYGDTVENHVISVLEPARNNTREVAYRDAGTFNYPHTEDTDSISEYLGKPSRFRDVKDNDRLSAAAEMFSDMGVITGYDDDTFRPDNLLTRAEAAAVLCRMFSITPENGCSFTDMDGHWAEEYAGAMQKAGIINGYADGSFQPDKYITYEELFKLVVSMLGRWTAAAHDEAEEKDMYPVYSNNYAMQYGLCDDLDSVVTGAPVTRGDMTLILSRAVDMHIITYVFRDARSYFGAETYGDETPASLLKGASLHGNITYTAKQFNEWFDKINNEYEEKYGKINEEFNNIITGNW